MKRKIYVILLSLSILTPIISFANEDNSELLQNDQESDIVIGNEYWTPCKVKNKSFNRRVYGQWFRIISGQGGPGVQLSATSERTISNSFSGNLKVTKSVLSASVGFDVSHTRKETASYTVVCPDSTKRYVLRGRDTKSEYKVTQERKYMVGNILSNTQSAIVYPQKWTNFDYGYYTESL